MAKATGEGAPPVERLSMCTQKGCNWVPLQAHQQKYNVWGLPRCSPQKLSITAHTPINSLNTQ